MGITWVTPYNLGHFNGDPFRASASSFFWLFLFSDLLSSTLLFSVTLPISTFHLSILSEVLTSKLPSNMYICTRPCRPPPAWDGSHIEIFLLPPCGVVGVWYCPPSPLWCGGGVVWYVGYVWCVWSVWYGMFGKYGMFGMYGRYGMYGMYVCYCMDGRCGNYVAYVWYMWYVW